jgi:hypothetical protein
MIAAFAVLVLGWGKEKTLGHDAERVGQTTLRFRITVE